MAYLTHPAFPDAPHRQRTQEGLRGQ